MTIAPSLQSFSSLSPMVTALANQEKELVQASQVTNKVADATQVSVSQALEQFKKAETRLQKKLAQQKSDDCSKKARQQEEIKALEQKIQELAKTLATQKVELEKLRSLYGKVTFAFKEIRDLCSKARAAISNYIGDTTPYREISYIESAPHESPNMGLYLASSRSPIAGGMSMGGFRSDYPKRVYKYADQVAQSLLNWPPGPVDPRLCPKELPELAPKTIKIIQEVFPLEELLPKPAPQPTSKSTRRRGL